MPQPHKRESFPHPPSAPVHSVMNKRTASNTRKAPVKKAKTAKPAEPRLSRTRRPPELEVVDWQTALRRQFGREQNFGLENLGQDPTFSDFRVANPVSGTRNRVTIRGVVPGHNFCTCLDYATTTLAPASTSNSRSPSCWPNGVEKRPWHADFSQAIAKSGSIIAASAVCASTRGRTAPTPC